MTKRDPEAALRAQKAIRLRASKISYEQIARTVGYSGRAACYTAVQRELDRSLVTDIEELRRESLLTLDLLHTELMQLATDRGNDQRLDAIRVLLSLETRRARLMGMDTLPDLQLEGVQVIVQEVPSGYFGALPPPPPDDDDETVEGSIA